MPSIVRAFSRHHRWKFIFTCTFSHLFYDIKAKHTEICACIVAVMVSNGIEIEDNGSCKVFSFKVTWLPKRVSRIYATCILATKDL
jgi:hypothetical protein